VLVSSYITPKVGAGAGLGFPALMTGGDGRGHPGPAIEPAVARSGPGAASPDRSVQMWFK